ncbi:bifunctional phosphopantothenoylcysteine decarboxylase/phosphopantothenate--cysteine ligase CoaBC [Pseudoteredinibacter isoporae]|uniref:Coenzyme A biosynthesis bifunctional protein CoaBC n=1 Tax=Pseudoteredinibacter isoporae TaxID=570281 RepID=A0A7X0JQP7_9GAMM|nr:bifunctional phosphopantothenoylcysteine decarboxylase/phosphopantothenate--cysteine ligase CoaBC [Pseudoteredinibacter isoporae]MBB6520417.1 phosphopantothenoylcysteine decarboxylase/phosphopantothenate--cysteine ligase [Pseudoteredinibacter isoporae]NHO85985.1 bifunctional phosphopantothenoylcysteine decarboxylase/phosphopantothenate--cysteine ligase CoaBC [Pseudoteredinibacter isoporae]NIB25563.1 bifunctional phosphopantothenoylcysteine decarboxylase/phosphopantothenate--cysteine ligase Co
MSSLQNKQILLGITGGIAAYKSAELVRRLQDQGAEVRVVMTKAAMEFITPLTLQALSGNPVHTELLDPEAEAGMGHIELARWGDLLIVAPASADFIARLAQGQGNDLLTTLCLARRSKLAVAPAMNQAMYANASTQDNLAKLAKHDIAIWGPASGAQACGDVGPGRMLEVDELVEKASAEFQTGMLAGKRVVITAGPTREAIDPVRYISNHSSGKMGYALAQACAEAGAICTLISGPTQLNCPPHCQRIDVESAQQMHEAALKAVNDCDIFIATAAVADFRPLQAADQKIKKQADSDTMTLEMVKNPDILADVANSQQRPFCVGFAAETQDVERYARGKLERKNLNMVIANDVSQQGIGFNSDDNQVLIVDAKGSKALDKLSKAELARHLIREISERFQKAD